MSEIDNKLLAESPPSANTEQSVVATPDKGIHFFNRPLGLVAIALYKTVWGFVEVAAGILLLFTNHLITSELAEDPTDLLARWLLKYAPTNSSLIVRAGEVLIVLGAIKLILGIGVWYRSWHIRNAAMIFFIAVALFGVYDLSIKFTAWKILVELADIAIVLYLWKILPRHLRDPGVK